MLLNQGLYNGQGFVKILNVIPNEIPEGYRSRDAVIANNARLCTQAEKLANDIEVYNFLEKLFNMGHYSPFEQATLQFNIKVPYATFSQIDRHRSFIYSSQLRRSGRYSRFTVEDFYIPEYFSTQSKRLLAETIFNYMDLYDGMVDSGELKPEAARFFLPGFCLLYEDIVTVNLKNLMHFLALRLDRHAQIEIRELAQGMFNLTKTLFPYTMKIFEENVKAVNYNFNEVV